MARDFLPSVNRTLTLLRSWFIWREELDYVTDTPFDYREVAIAVLKA